MVKVKLRVTRTKKKKKKRSELRKRESVNGDRLWEDSGQKARNNPQFYNLDKAFIFTRRSGRASFFTTEIWDFHITLKWHFRKYSEESNSFQQQCL